MISFISIFFFAVFGVQNYKISHENESEWLFFCKCKIRFCQMQKAFSFFLLTFAPEFKIIK